MYKKLKQIVRQKVLQLIEMRLNEYADGWEQKFARQADAMNCYHEQIEQKVKNRKEELEQEIENSKEEIERKIERCEEEIEKFHLLKLGHPVEYCYMNVMNQHAVKQRIADIKNNVNADWNQLGIEFQNEIYHKLEAVRTDSIVIVCRGLRALKRYEAIRAEAYQIFLLLKCRTNFDVKLVSVESEQEEMQADASIVYLPESKIKQYFSNISIRLCIALEATIQIALMADGLLLKYHTIVRLSGQNPLGGGIPKEKYENLLHVNDLGMLQCVVFSRYAKNVLEKAGFKQVQSAYPIIDKNKIAERAYCREQKEKMVIGFASSPMEQKQSEDRGVTLLCNLIRKAAEFDFLILWRDQAVLVPEQILKAGNCKVVYGFYNMKQFYREIDCLLIPYRSANNNHACSISALEAMLAAIPVVCTSHSGISELVKQLEAGYVCKAEEQSLYEAILKVKEKGICPGAGYKRELLEAKLDAAKFVEETLQRADEYVPDEIITLDEWRSKLEANGRYLVKGQVDIKKYYSQMEIAANYNEDRFVRFPQNCFDFLERKAVCAMIQDKYKGKKIELLDIAPGDGRIVQEALHFGPCTAIDASKAMLEVLKKRFQGNERLSMIHADYLEQTVDKQYDVVTTFRYIRHFEYLTRKSIYKKIYGNLKENGLLILDVPNIVFEMKLREITGWGNYNIYDMFWTKESMVKELEEHGFYVEYIIAIGNGLMDEMPETYSKEPISWTFGAVKKQTGEME